MINKLKLLIKSSFNPPETAEQKIKKYIKSGMIPWSEGYKEFKWQQITQVINDEQIINNFKLQKAISNFGVALDERIVEYPWIISNLFSVPNKILDAGSTFNFKEIIDNKIIAIKKKTILTYFPESPNYNEFGISYVYSDLRDIPFRDQYFDEIVCQSTLEHIDMDNSMYGYKSESNTSPKEKSFEYLTVVKELVRVLNSQGQLLITVPFGVFENHGFFQQFDKEMILKIRNLLELFGSYSEQYFKYTIQGWESSNQNECNSFVSYNPHTGKGKGTDTAAHSRSICCIKFIRK